jgi:hypothetical protein
MEKQEVFKKLDGIFENKKARGFLNHLIKSYVPHNKVEKVFVTPKGKFNCVLTNKKLISVNHILNGVKEESFKNDFFEYLHNMLKPEAEAVPPVQKLIGKREMGVQGKDTDTFMSVKVYVHFYDWVMSKYLSGDKHINWLLRGVNGLKSNNQSKVSKKSDNMGGRATYTLGDLEALQKLKAKMN